jgi:hypothetical protein
MSTILPIVGPVLVIILVLAVLVLPYLHGIGLIGTRQVPTKSSRARASILEAEQLAVHEDQGMADLRLVLMVKVAGHPQYRLRVKRLVPIADLNNRFAVGQKMEIMVGPGSMERIAIPGLDEQNSV